MSHISRVFEFVICSEFLGIFRLRDTCEMLFIYFNLKLTFTILRKIQFNTIERIKLVNTAPERACILHVYSIVASVFRRQQFLNNFLQARYYTNEVFAFACNQIAFWFYYLMNHHQSSTRVFSNAPTLKYTTVSKRCLFFLSVLKYFGKCTCCRLNNKRPILSGHQSRGVF